MTATVAPAAAALRPYHGRMEPNAAPASTRADGIHHGGIRLGTIFGIEIRAQWSVLIVFVLLASSIGTGLVPESVDDPGTVAPVVGGVVGAALFLASLLAHELSHSLVARRHGVRVRSITLWLFGGIATLERDADDARAEFRIALAGPLMSIALAVGFGVVAVALDAADDPSVALGTAFVVANWLAVINGILAVFNLLPGAPLDGGRVLRAWLWKRSGDRLGSQRRAAHAGRGLAKVLIALGLVEFAFGAGLAGLWMAFIGWFILSAASAEELDAELRTELGGVRVGAVMTRDPTTVAPTISVQQLADEFLLSHRSSYPVVDRGTLLGLVTLSDVRALPVARRSTTTVETIMTPAAECRIVHPDDEFVEALSTAGGPTRFLVVDDSGLIGIVTPTDVARLVEMTHVVGTR